MKTLAPTASSLVLFFLCLLAGLAAGCGHEHSHEDSGHEHEEPHDHDDGHDHDDDHGDDGWSITAWGEGYEVFPEIDALIAGEPADAHVHVTRLDGFAPLAEGTVEIVLRADDGAERVFRAEAATRSGVFDIQLRPSATGDFDLAFRIVEAGAEEEIRGGRVRVGTAASPGGVTVAPAPKAGDGGEPVDFLKEQQWRSDFATSWVRRGELAESVRGLVRVRPPAGGEAMVSSPLDGVVRAVGPWPFAGRSVLRGTPLFRVAPQISAGQSLAQLEATAASLEIEKNAVTERLARLEELLELEATSRREVEEVRQHAEVLEARHRAARLDLDAARSARGGGGYAGSFVLTAPFAGEVATVSTTPGATVAAGETLARLVRTDAVWLEIALSPADARRLAPGRPLRGMVLTDARGRTPIELETVEVVSVAPEISPTTGKVVVYLEAPVDSGARREIVQGSTLDGVVRLDESTRGVVVPASAIVDDGGVSVVYLQLSGESFQRQEVESLERQGDRVLIAGLEPGQRLVERGGNAIRRSSLMSSGEAHGHVH